MWTRRGISPGMAAWRLPRAIGPLAIGPFIFWILVSVPGWAHELLPLVAQPMRRPNSIRLGRPPAGSIVWGFSSEH